MPRRRSRFIFSWFALTLFLSFPRTLAQQAKPDFTDQLEERIFKPLGMTRTTLRPTMAMTWPLVQGHDVSGREKPKVVRPAADQSMFIGR